MKDGRTDGESIWIFSLCIYTVELALLYAVCDRRGALSILVCLFSFFQHQLDAFAFAILFVFWISILASACFEL